MQLKGRVLDVRESSAEDEGFQERYLAGFVEQLSCVGMTRSVVRRLCVTPSWAVRFAVEEVFDQTPGPQAGGPLRPEASP